MSPIQGSKWLILMMVALAHYPVFCRTFGADFEHPTFRGADIEYVRLRRREIISPEEFPKGLEEVSY